MSHIKLRHATEHDWDAIAELIHHSTNAWYLKNRNSKIFLGAPSETRLFCEVYEDLDPGRCLIAEDTESGTIAGSCFYHPRETHVSLGIMNSHPDYAGQGIARRLLTFILDFSNGAQKPLRLVSSAMNLDSFSLYNRAGLAPYAIYQDMVLEVPDAGIPDAVPKGKTVRDATPEDIAAIVALEEQVFGIRRGPDFEYFINNASGDWHMSVIVNASGQLDGFLASIQHPASALLGPGCMRSDDDAIALIRRELSFRKGHTMVWLVPSDRPAITQAMYQLKAKNCELHLGLSTSPTPQIQGIVMPTFMPETA